MLIERGPIARTECYHRHGHGISLVFEEQSQVARLNIPQSDFGFIRELLHSDKFGSRKPEIIRRHGMRIANSAVRDWFSVMGAARLVVLPETGR